MVLPPSAPAGRKTPFPVFIANGRLHSPEPGRGTSAATFFHRRPGIRRKVLSALSSSTASHSLDASWQLRVLSPAGGLAGAAVTVSPRHIVTCAHVVTDALGLERPTPATPRPRTPVLVDAPRSGALSWRGRATVVEAGWFCAAPPWDVAVLELEDPAPVPPAVLGDDSGVRLDQSVRILGYTDVVSGIWTQGVLNGRGGDRVEFVQINLAGDGQARIRGGFSGSGVCHGAELLGIVRDAHWENLDGGAGVRAGRIGWMIPISLIPPVWAKGPVGALGGHRRAAGAPPGAASAPEDALAEALCSLPSFGEEHRGELDAFLSRCLPWARIEGTGDRRALARGVVDACSEEDRLHLLLRWLCRREDGSRVRRALRTAETLVKAEEIRLFGRGGGSPELVPAEQVRLALRSMAFASVSDAYLHACRNRLEEDLPSPLTAWDALIDLYDLPHTGAEGHPAALFAHWVAPRIPDPSAAKALVDWPPARYIAPPRDLPARSGGGTDPARLIVQVLPGADADGRLLVTHRTHLRPTREGEARFSAPTTASVETDRLKDHVLDLLFDEIEASARRGNHDSVRLELVLPLERLGVAAARWEQPVPGLEEDGRAPRLGASCQIIYRVHEFASLAERSYHRSRHVCRARWARLEQVGHGLLRTRQDLAPGLRVSEALGDEAIAVYLAPPPETAEGRAQIAGAVYNGVPVIAWCAEPGGNNPGSAANLRVRFRPLIAEEQGQVGAHRVKSLPETLHTLRVGGGAEEGGSQDSRGGTSGIPATDNFDFCVIYHDLMPLAPPDSGTVLATSRAG